MKDWVIKNGQVLINLYLFINIIGFILWQAYTLYANKKLDFIEITFILNNCALAWVVLIRQKHVALDHDIWHQCIALIAFFSGIAFLGQPANDTPSLVFFSQIILLTASLLGLVSLFNLKESFGILIACRTVKTKGLYAYVRHPMYATDILLRIGYLISHFNLTVLLLFILSTACYLYRAILEEKFLLAHSDAYKNYKQIVRYRFIPGLI